MTMIMIDKAVVEQALEALAIGDNIALVGSAYTPKSIDAGVAKMRTAMEVLREALAQPMTLNGNDIFQDTEGTIPVTAVGQQVGFVAQQLIPTSDAGVFLEGPQAQQPVQEPVAEVVMATKPQKASPAWLPFKTVYAPISWLDRAPIGTKLYTSPQAQPQPVPMAWKQIETAPKDGQMILICLPRQMNIVVRAWYNRIHNFWQTDYEGEGGITRPMWFHEGDLWHPIPPINGITKDNQ